jgi:hypothetical protein
MTLSRLTGRGSKDKLIVSDSANVDEPVIVIDQVQSLEKTSNVHSPTTEKKDTGLSRSKSKKDKKERLRSKSREPGETLDKGKHKEKKRPDRECVVM